MKTYLRWLWLILTLMSGIFFPVANAASDDLGLVSSRPFALVWRLDGELISSHQSEKRALRVGDVVYEGERLAAGVNAEAVLKVQDGGVIAIRSGTVFTALQFRANGTTSDISAIELVKGSLRIISGWIGKLNRKGSVLTTPTATIGIRGTDHEPYVLLDDDEEAIRFKPGTYDKVSQGGTTLTASGQSLEIDPGKVGFARAAPKSRALMTLLFPVLLDKVPDFYIPGKFDAEVDELAKHAESNNQRQLQARQKQAAACVPQDVAKRWIAALDQNIVKGNSSAILDMFAQDVTVKASVRAGDGKMTDLELPPVEFADSIVTAVSSLKDYKHRRISIEGKATENGAAACGEVAVRSVVIEEGRQGNKPYRFESEEKYILRQIDDVWRAAQAFTRQR